MDDSIQSRAVKKNAIPRQIKQDDVDGKQKETKATTFLSPSKYIECMKTNPEVVMLQHYKKRESPFFTVDPKVVIFKNFEPAEIYCTILTIQNTSPLPHILKLSHTENVSFDVTFKGCTLNTWLAAGMAHTYEVQFRPDEKRDYRYDIQFETDGEWFAVPVIGVGPRALFSFPDEIDMGKTAVKVAQVNPIFLQNIGEVPTGFSVYTDNSCLTVEPAKGFLKVDETKQLLVNFLPTKSGYSSARIFIRYDGGDTVQTMVFGEAAECDVRVAEKNIVMEDTYFGLSRLTFIEIQNNSEFMLDYEWVKFESVEEELKEKEQKILEATSDLISDTDSITSEAQELIKERVASDKTELLMQESFQFDDDDFIICPIRSHALPRSTTKVSLTFQPTKVGDIESHAYLNIGGLENRICFSFTGKCLGPALRLNVLSLDIQKVYLCSAYNYEIICENFGPIPGTIMHLQKCADFGSTIRVEPNEIKVDMGELKPMNLRFCSERSGEFVERVDFVIKESSDILSFVLKGHVICPLKKICKNKLNFQSASVGFKSKQKIWIKNLSHASMQFNFKVPSDGYETGFSYIDFSRAPTKPTLPKCPCEFYINPNEGIIEPENCICVEVSYTPNIARSGETQLLANPCRSPSSQPLAIPISFNAKLASFEVCPAEMYVRFCFVNFPYCRTLIIANTSDAHGYFYFVPQEVSENDEVLYSLSTYQGHLEPGHCAEISVTLIVQEIGEHKVDLNLFGLGFETPIKCCEITCHGKGPVVSVEPSQLNWGETKLLEKHSFDLKITNDSPISAKFTATTNKHKAIWNADPSVGELNPNESMTLKVTAFLRDTGKFIDRLSITIFNGQTINVALSAIGVGCCIVFEPSIFPEFNMGYQFSRQDISIPIIVKNEGTKTHHLLLTNVEKPRQAKKTPVEETKSLFKIEPNTLEAPPGSTHTIHCNIRWNANEIVEEQWYLHATIEGQTKRELLGSSLFTAVFMEPDISFDKNEIKFRLDFGHDRQDVQKNDEIVITNQSGRDLSAHLTIDKSFRLIEKCNCSTDYIETVFQNNEPFVLRVYFPFDNSCCEPLPKTFDGYLRIEYDEHKQIDTIPCRAEVNYPHLIFIPDEVKLYCATGKFSEEKVKFVNDTPLPVIYKIEWLKEMFSCRSLSSMADSGSECSHFNDADKSTSTFENYHERSSSMEDACEGAEEILSDSDQSLDMIDKFLQISPEKGHLLPNSEVEVTFIFNGFQRTRISAQAICYTKGGKTKILNVQAIADDVKCELQNEVLDFGLGLFCEPSSTTLIIYNRCLIPLAWTIDTTSEYLSVVDALPILEPNAENIIRMERSPTPPGLFCEKMILDIAYLEPFLIDVKWLSTIPQVYFDTPRDKEFEKYPVEFGYEAVRMVIAEGAVQDEKFVETMCLSSSSENEGGSEEEQEEKEFSEYGLTQLIDDGWDIIDNKTENYPSRIDIDMAFERLLVKNSVDPITSAPSYSIDVGFVVVEQTSQLSVPLKNYGYEKAKVLLKMNSKVRKPTEACFYFELEKNTEICQCESTILNVTFRPKKKVFTQKRTNASYKFQLEVKNGLTIPVTVKAAAVYPCVTVNIENLDFEKVFVGECRRMSFLMKNDGFVDCHWFTSLSNTTDVPKKCEEDPFYVGHANGLFVPGQEETMYIYFRPLQNGVQKYNITITVLNGYETKTICLTGCGIERKISISRSTIKCTPVIPNVNVSEKYLTVKNPNTYPVELYWGHLTDFSESNRIVRLLKHYYSNNEILIPQRKFGETMPSIFYDFYKELIRQMCTDPEFKNCLKGWFRVDKVLSDASINGSEKTTKTKKDKSAGDLKKSKSKSQVEKDDFERLSAAVASAPPDKVEFLLSEYIGRLKERPNFMEANDPLSELYRIADEDMAENVNLNEERVKNLIVIFYGPSFTEPQETACKTAKSLNLPLLNLNQIFLEALAFSQTESAKKLADQLDSRYKELTTKLEKLKAVLLKKNANNATEFLKLSNKIPPKEELDSMNSYDRCELKLDIITSILNFMESNETFGTSSVKDKASMKSQDGVGKRQSVLLSVGRDTYQNVLRERLCQDKFGNGYVLQTLNNDFLRNETTVMKMLIEATGNVKMRLFITFHGYPDFDDRDSNNEEEDVSRKCSELILKSIADYQNGLIKLMETISNWENGYAEPNKSVKGRKNEQLGNVLINPLDSFSIWYINVSKSKQAYDAVAQQLKSIVSRLEDKEELMIYMPESKIFSILREYKNAIEPADNFSLSLLDANDEDQPLEAHLTLQPRSSQKIKISFQASESGKYDSEFFLTLLDNPAATFRIGVEGIADIPRLDVTPSAVFNAVKNIKFNETHDPCYFVDSETYDFGCLLVLNENKLHKRSTQFKFKNISAVPVSVSFSLASESYDCFDIHPQQTEIKISETAEIEITASALNIGSNNDTLIAKIENNGQPLEINLESTGVELQVEINPKQLNLGRILLGRIEKYPMTIRNHSRVALHWHLTCGSGISFVPACGKIKSRAALEIELQYYASNVGTDKKLAQIAWFLAEDTSDPIDTDIIEIIVETYEILYNIDVENPVDFGSVTVGTTATKSFTLKNLGPYEFEFALSNTDSTHKRIREADFLCHPPMGLVMPKKQIDFRLCYTPNVELKLQDAGWFNLEIIEPYKNIGSVGSFDIKLSVISYFTKFVIEPYPNLNFGTLALNSTKSMQFKIKNIGKFPLAYTISSQPLANQTEAIRQDSTSKKNKKSIQSEKTTAKRMNSMANLNLKCGPFIVDKFKGELDVNEEYDIGVQCSSESIGDFEEKLSITVENSRENREFSLLASIQVAEIDWQDFEAMFAGSYIVDASQNVAALDEPEVHTVFSIAEQCLHFRRVCVGTQYSANITLRNISLIDGDVTIEIDSDTFKVGTNSLNVPAMSRKTFSVVFSPDQIDTFSTTLKMSLDLPSTLEPQTLSIDLLGKGYVPQISIIDPPPSNLGVLTLNFGLSYICEWREKLIQIQNVGEIAANVVVETMDDSDGNCKVPDSDESRLLCGCVDEDSGTSRSIFKIQPYDIQPIRIHFFPVRYGKYDNCLKIFVEQNPYEVFEMNVTGEGFCKPVVIENLEIMETPQNGNSRRSSRQKSQKRVSFSHTSSKTMHHPTLTYKLDYGICFLNKPYKINFKITNKTTDRYYRFEWTIAANVTCSPVAGHVMPDSFKEVTATFFACEPMNLSHIPLDCKIHEILLTHPPVGSSSWDTRQTEVLWMEKSPSLNECTSFDDQEFYFKKLVIESQEPEFTFVPDTMQVVQLLVSAVADYSDYHCNVNCIEFDDTLMFQTKEHKLTLQNPSTINLNFSWELTMDECYPIRLDQSTVPSTSTSESNKSEFVVQSPRQPPNTPNPLKHTVTIRSTESEESTSDLFSSSAGMTNRSTDSWIEGENWPFEIVPECGSVSSGEEVECVLRFKPVDVFKYKAYLWCRMENLNPIKEPLNVVVMARSLLPYCHFDIEPTDYLSKRDIHLPVPLGYSLADSETKDLTKVVEFRIIGVEECHTRSLYVINPTTEDYNYHWSQLHTNENDEEQFSIQCSNETGLAERGKRTQITFTVVPKKIGTFESFWSFEVEKYDLTTLFLVVVKVCEPDVTCKNALVKLPTAIIREIQTASFEITNNECCDLKFYVDENSMFSDGRRQRICICPMHGTLEQNASQSFCVGYEASLVGEHNFKVLCHVQKMKKPIRISIIAEVKDVLPTVFYVDADGLEIKLDESSSNLIELKGLLLNMTTKLPFKIANSGEIAFDYQWKLPLTDEDKFKINPSDFEGTVGLNSHEISFLDVTAKQKVNICTYDVKLEIKSGPTYRIKLNSETQKPPLEFSFKRYNFGLCYILEKDISQLNTVDLFITNHQKFPCFVRCKYNESLNFTFNLDELSRAIPPNESARVTINFTPLAESLYEETLRFSSSADSTIKKNIIIQGEGISYKIRLKNPCEAILDLGNIPINKAVTRKLCIINCGRLPVELKPIIRGTASEFVKISSNAHKILKPNRELTVTLVFKPTRRAKSIKAEIGFEMDGVDSVILTTIKANCFGSEMRLNRKCVSFGMVYEKCSVEEKVVLINDGDVGSKFCWCLDKMKKEFSVTPLSGYSSPGSEVTFLWRYEPGACSQMEAILELEEHENLTLNLAGSTCQLPEPKEVIDFKTEIKQSHTQEITINNDSNQRWNLKPKIFGEYFTSATTISVDPKTIDNFTVTYSPKKLTAQESLDEGKLIIPLPDGRPPVVYNLQGRCTPAIISQKMIRTVPSKKKHFENLVVYNNTDWPRSYECTMEQDNKKVDCEIGRVNVPANSSKRCKLPFYFENPGDFYYKVTFDDGYENYQYYEIDFTVTNPEITNSIELITTVRVAAFTSLKIGNSSKDEAATFDGICSSQDVVLHGLPTSLKPLAFKNLRIEYFPLLPGEAVESLEIESSVSGSVFYELRLKAKQALPEKATWVNACLGSSANFWLPIKNYSKDTVIFSVEVDNSSFTCQEIIEVLANDESTLKVNFEPHSLDCINSRITATSETAGELIFPITGQSTPPQPQGPFVVASEVPTTINFKNVFLESSTFELVIDNPIFKVENSSITIDSKESTNIVIKLLPNTNNNKRKTETGKLLIIPDNFNIKWTYYLKAKRNSSNSQQQQ